MPDARRPLSLLQAGRHDVVPCLLYGSPRAHVVHFCVCARLPQATADRVRSLKLGVRAHHDLALSVHVRQCGGRGLRLCLGGTCGDRDDVRQL